MSEPSTGSPDAVISSDSAALAAPAAETGANVNQQEVAVEPIEAAANAAALSSTAPSDVMTVAQELQTAALPVSTVVQKPPKKRQERFP